MFNLKKLNTHTHTIIIHFIVGSSSTNLAPSSVRTLYQFWRYAYEILLIFYAFFLWCMYVLVCLGMCIVMCVHACVCRPDFNFSKIVPFFFFLTDKIDSKWLKTYSWSNRVYTSSEFQSLSLQLRCTHFAARIFFFNLNGFACLLFPYGGFLCFLMPWCSRQSRLAFVAC